MYFCLQTFISGLQKFTKYEVNVAAQSEYGIGPFSNLTTFTTLEDSERLLFALPCMNRQTYMYSMNWQNKYLGINWCILEAHSIDKNTMIAYMHSRYQILVCECVCVCVRVRVRVHVRE